MGPAPRPAPPAAATPPAGPPPDKRQVRQFHDRMTRCWKFELSLEMAEEILRTTSELAAHPDPALSRGVIAIDLLNVTDEMLYALYTNLRVLSAAMWVCLADQAKEFNVDLSEFRRSMDGPCIGAAKERFWEALQDFFPDLATSLQQLSKEQQESRAEVARRMRELAPQRRAAILDVVDHFAQQELADLQQAAKRLKEGTDPSLAPMPADASAAGSPPSESASPSESTGDASASGSSSSGGKRGSASSGAKPQRSPRASTT